MANVGSTRLGHRHQTAGLPLFWLRLRGCPQGDERWSPETEQGGLHSPAWVALLQAAGARVRTKRPASSGKREFSCLALSWDISFSLPLGSGLQQKLLLLLGLPPATQTSWCCPTSKIMRADPSEHVSHDTVWTGARQPTGRCVYSYVSPGRWPAGPPFLGAGNWRNTGDKKFIWGCRSPCGTREEPCLPTWQAGPGPAGQESAAAELSGR